jgi:aspartyl-tRNA(Asn)/glutamyl-tRNA(Gln) amidotransferase subunit B
MEHAIEFEARRQIEILEGGGTIEQETRLYDPERDETRSMRTKEEAHDYRYFPDPDLLPLEIEERTIEELRRSLPELPDARHERFVREYALSEYDADVLTASRAVADYFEAVARQVNPKLAANWVCGELTSYLRKYEMQIERSPISADTLAWMIGRIVDGTISGKIAKEKVFPDLWDGKNVGLGKATFESLKAYIEAEGLKQVSDAGAIEKVVDEVLAKNAKQVEDYRAGKEKAFNSLVGQVMKATQGKANPAQVNEILRRKLKS